FLEHVDRTYTAADQDRYLLERSLALSSGEMQARATELQTALTALRASEERFRALVQNASDIIVVLDAAGCVQHVSLAAERLLGYAPEEWIGRNPFILIHPDDRDRCQQALVAVAQEPGTHPPLQFRLQHADGSW